MQIRAAHKEEIVEMKHELKRALVVAEEANNESKKLRTKLNIALCGKRKIVSWTPTTPDPATTSKRFAAHMTQQVCESLGAPAAAGPAGAAAAAGATTTRP